MWFQIVLHSLARSILRLDHDHCNQPLFTIDSFAKWHQYHLLGGWSVSGETFIVKDTKNFSEKVIPTVYKHNNFSSFVRQLNFCE